MRDNQLFAVIIPIIRYGLTAQGITDIAIQQSFQSTQQGVNTGSTVYIFKISDHRYGYVGKEDTWDAGDSKEIHVERQIYETTFQISALVPQDLTTVDSYTTSDIVNSVAASLQSDYAITAFDTNNIGILRITDVRNPYFLDDRDQYEASPSFDFTLLHEQVISSTVNATAVITGTVTQV